MNFEYSALSDVGRHRANNEDAVMVDPARGIVVLADGMGGYNAGEVASALAVDLIAGELGRWLEEAATVASTRDVRRAMEICVDNANRSIFDAAHTHEAYAGMGTTLVMGVLHQGVFVIGHVGDSRAYRWREGMLARLTRDHSLLQEQIDIGLITEEEAAASGNRNLVTRALGVEDTVLLDLQETDIAFGDVFLLCSDGLCGVVPREQLAATLAGPGRAQELADRLYEAALAAESHDNITAVVVGFRG